MNELLISLNEQHSNLNEFLEIVQKQQRALIESNITSLEECILSEEKILKRIEAGEKVREEVMQKLSQTYSIKLNSLSVSDFLNQLGTAKNPVIEKIFKMSKELKSVITQINKINYQNKKLINHSRNFIKETVNVIFGNSGSQLLDKRF